MIGRYIDSLMEHERDRVIEGQGWCCKAMIDAEGNRCLAGHAEISTSIFECQDWEAKRRRWNFEIAHGHDTFAGVGAWFDRLADRIGLDRAVRLVKTRAARGNSVSLGSPPKCAVLELETA